MRISVLGMVLSVGLCSPVLGDCGDFSIQVHYGKPVFAVGEPVDLTLSGAPGTLGVLLFDTQPGPLLIPGVGELGVGLSSDFVLLALPPLPAGGMLQFCCNFPCESAVVGTPIYTQAVSVDLLSLGLCPSDVDVLRVEDLNGLCVPSGCSQGYWKNHQDSWAATGYAPTDDFDTVFGIDAFTPDSSLIEALNPVGSPYKKLPVQAVAALLNSAHPGENFPLSTQEVIDAVANAIASGDAAAQEALKTSLDQLNNLGCTLN